jgi:chemotaxis protein MotB
LPAEHMAAAGFGEFQPLDKGNSADALAKNRRIEIRLDQR